MIEKETVMKCIIKCQGETSEYYEIVHKGDKILFKDPKFGWHFPVSQNLGSLIATWMMPIAVDDTRRFEVSVDVFCLPFEARRTGDLPSDFILTFEDGREFEALASPLREVLSPEQWACVIDSAGEGD